MDIFFHYCNHKSLQLYIHKLWFLKKKKKTVKEIEIFKIKILSYLFISQTLCTRAFTAQY